MRSVRSRWSGRTHSVLAGHRILIRRAHRDGLRPGNVDVGILGTAIGVDLQFSLENQLERRLSREGSGTVHARVCPLITTSPDASAMRPHVDLNLFKILGVTGGESRAVEMSA